MSCSFGFCYTSLYIHHHTERSHVSRGWYASAAPRANTLSLAVDGLLILLASLSRISVRCGWSPEVNPSDIRIELRGMRTRNPHCFLALNAEPGVRRTVRSTVSRTRSGPSELGGRARIPMQRNFPAPIPLLLRPAAGLLSGVCPCPDVVHALPSEKTVDAHGICSILVN